MSTQIVYKAILGYKKSTWNIIDRV